MALHVAAAQPALAQGALADGVEAEQLVLAVGLPHVHHHFLAAHERPLVLRRGASKGETQLFARLSAPCGHVLIGCRASAVVISQHVLHIHKAPPCKLLQHIVLQCVPLRRPASMR